MLNCPRCDAITDGGMAYCGTCYRPRIAESLRSPVPEPDWLRPLQQTLLVVASLWFLITFGVAFLREWKAIRDSRALLIQNHPDQAWAVLAPFLVEHPQNKQALLLCGQETIRLDLQAEPKSCLANLTQQSPELAKQLGDDYRQVLTAKTRALGCNGQSFEKLLAQGQDLGPPYRESVVAGLDGVVDACRTKKADYMLSRLDSVEKQELVEKGYVPSIRRAVTQARYVDAKILAQIAERTAPDKKEAVETVIGAERSKVSASAATLRGLCDSLKNDPRYHPGGSWCFPAAAPPAVQTAKNGWGQPYYYAPVKSGGAQECNSGFILSSYSPGGTAEGESREISITCRFISGYESWQPPNSFWLERDGG